MPKFYVVPLKSNRDPDYANQDPYTYVEKDHAMMVKDTIYNNKAVVIPDDCLGEEAGDE